MKNRTKLATILLVFVAMFSCEKTKNEPTCNCYEYHEKSGVIFPNGTPQTTYLFDYKTSQTSTDCSTATDWIYTTQGRRYKVICE